MRTMRIGGLLLLLVAFVFGIVSAFVVAFFTLDAKPIAVVDKGPTVKILVAKESIAVGEEITAEAIVFQEVPVSELPERAMSSFFQVCRRRPAYPIAPGCPICEDLLIPKNANSEEKVRFIPVGSQIVLLEVEQVRLNRNIADTPLPITQILSTEDSIDLHVVPRQEPLGVFAERKNSLLRTYAPEQTEKKEEIGELILENIAIHDVRSSGHAVEGRQYQTVSLLLENGQVDKLHQAAREGRLRIALHNELKSEPVEETTEQNLQAVMEPEQKIEPQPEHRSEPKTVRLIGALLEEQPLAVVEEKEVPATPISQNISFVAPKTLTPIKNEPVAMTPVLVEKPTDVVKAPSKSAAVGLAYSSEKQSSVGYSPFDIKSRAVAAETEEPTVPKQLPLRQRFQWN